MLLDFERCCILRPLNISFWVEEFKFVKKKIRVILGRRIRICREKIFLTTSWVSTGILLKQQFGTSLVPGSGPKIFFSVNLKSTTQSYPKTIYQNNLFICICPCTTHHIWSPILAQEVTKKLFSTESNFSLLT